MARSITTWVLWGFIVLGIAFLVVAYRGMPTHHTVTSTVDVLADMDDVQYALEHYEGWPSDDTWTTTPKCTLEPLADGVVVTCTARLTVGFNPVERITAGSFVAREKARLDELMAKLDAEIGSH